jgi:crossover junction endodeoxyribonuclease RuvC
MTTTNIQRVIALDLATTTGYALAAGGVFVHSASASFARDKGTKRRAAEHIGQPMLNFQRWLRERIQEDKPTAFAFEDVFRWSSSDAAKVFCGLRGILMLNAAYYGIPVFGYSPGHVKKFFTGNGNAPKELMVAQAIARYPELAGEDIDDNRADAIAVLMLHLNQTQEVHA